MKEFEYILIDNMSSSFGNASSIPLRVKILLFRCLRSYYFIFFLQIFSWILLER